MRGYEKEGLISLNIILKGHSDAIIMPFMDLWVVLQEKN